MPKLARGCYEKIGYPKTIVVEGETFNYIGSGSTRMVYASELRPDVIAKVMPANSSRHWRPSWDQNRTEAASLLKLIWLDAAPEVFSHRDVPFMNKWSEVDIMDVLVVGKLGPDLQEAAELVSFEDYTNAYWTATNAIEQMAARDVVVLDPHPYNCSLEFGSTSRALPCDFGECVATTTAALRKSLKNLFHGYRQVAKTTYGRDLTAEWATFSTYVVYAEHPLNSEFRIRNKEFFEAARKSLPAESRPQSTSNATSEQQQAWSSPPPQQHWGSAAPPPPRQHWGSAAPPPPQQHWSSAAPPPPQQHWGSAAPPPPQQHWGSAAPQSPQQPWGTSALQPGSFALISGLQHKTELNGQSGFIKELVGDRCILKLRDQSMKSMPQTAARPIPDPRDAWVCRTCNADVYWRGCPDASWTGKRGRWKCGPCSVAPQPTPEPPPAAAPPAPPATPPPPLRTLQAPVELVWEADVDKDKYSILDFMTWMLRSATTRDERKAFYQRYLLDHHADHHPEWREAGNTAVILRQVELCDYVKRTRSWFLQL